MKKSLTAGLSALALAASAASVALIGGSTASHAAGEPSSAFGAELTIAGNEVIAADTIAVESTDGSNVSDSLATFPDNPVLTGGLVEVEAENNFARATIADLSIGEGLLAQLPEQLTTPLDDACTQLESQLDPVEDGVDQVDESLLGGLEGALDQVAEGADSTGSGLDLSALASLDLQALTPNELSGLCDVLSGELRVVGATAVEAQCNGDTGTATVADLTAAGLPIEANTGEPNQSVTIPGLLDLTINRQTTNANGTFTVDALHVILLDQVELTLASATCGEVTQDAPDQPDEPDAPSPTPVPTSLPVTG